VRAIAAEVGCFVGSVRGAVGAGHVGAARGGHRGKAQERSGGYSSAQLALTEERLAFIQQRIRDFYRWQRSAALPSRIAKCGHQSQLGVDGFDVAHARSIWLRPGVAEFQYLSYVKPNILGNTRMLLML
jgi:hypothetical protein